MSDISNSSAGRRIEALLDDNSFVEIGKAVTARATDFNLNPSDAASDGVITGYGVIDGNLVYVFSQNAAVLGGSVGEMHAKKIVNIYKMAMKMGAPVIGLIDSTGLRLQESVDALAAFGDIYKIQAMASGVIPQLVAVFGGCGGGLAVMSEMADFTFMEETKGKLFVNSPNAVAGNYEGKVDTASAAYQAKETGCADYVGDEASVIGALRTFASILPANNEVVADAECTDDLNRLVPDIKGGVEDSSIALSMIADEGTYFEVKSEYAQDMVTAFMQLDGITVGAVANRTKVFDEESKEAAKFDAVLTAQGARKAADFVNFCDAFEIPVLTLTNTTGFAASECQEKKIAKAAAALTYAFANATVPKVNLITGKAFGTAGIAMNSKNLGADMVFAWDSSEIGTMDAELAAKVMYDGQAADVVKEKAAEYKKLQNSAASAARRGYVDAVIDPADTRKQIIGAFEMLYTKSEDRPEKKHGSI